MRLLVLVGNDLHKDSRVEKIIENAVAQGYETSVICRSSNRDIAQSLNSQVEVFRLDILNKPAAKAHPKTLFWRIILGLRAIAKAQLRKVNGNKVKETSFQFVLDEYVRKFAPKGIEISPDLIHANDADMLPVAIRIKEELAKQGKSVKVIYDAHEYTRGVHRANSTWLPAMRRAEDSNIKKADAVLTVTSSIAELIQTDHQLEVRPTLIMNAPSLSFTKQDSPFPTLRQELGLATEVPLFVYLGVTAPARGLHTVIEALPQLPDVHLALVTTENSTTDQLKTRAEELGAANRLHIVPMVSHEWVSSYIRGCTAGVNPALHNPNHEHSVSTKFYEYLHAHVPIIVSDLRDMKLLTEDLGNGEVFVAEDVEDFVAAAQRLLINPAKYQLAMTNELLNEFSWETQLAKLNGVYRGL